MIRASIAFAIGLALSTSLMAQQWSRFRGAQASGVAEADLPTTWSDSKNVAWKTRLPGRGSSSPVVWGDRVFVTAYSGYGMDIENPGDRENLQLHVLCLGLSDGKLIWNCLVDPAAEEQAIGKRVAEHGYASPTPCVDDFAVYAYFGPSGIVAVSHDGQLIWRRSLGTNTVGFGAAASPIVHGDLLIQNASIESGTLFGLDKKTGEIKWQNNEVDKAWTTPTMLSLSADDPSKESGQELNDNQKMAVIGFDPQTGERLWFCDAIEDYIVPCVITDGQLLYCSGGRSNKTFVLRPGGRGDVSESHLVWEQSRGANVTSPVKVGDYLYWSHDKSIALCLRASDGEEMFRERLPTRARVYGSIVSDGKHLFLTTRDKGVLVLAAQPEYKEIAVNVLGDPEERFNATPAIADDRLLIRSDRTLYCVSHSR